MFRGSGVVVLSVLGVLGAGSGFGQTGPERASDLVKRLHCGSDRECAFPGGSPSVSCGSMGPNGDNLREVARSLAMLGTEGLPVIERSLGEVEKNGLLSAFGYNATWLMYAYAKADGPQALPRLERIRGLKIDSFEYAIDSAVALALGLTSYVSAPQMLGLGEPICRPWEPRDALDRLILAWETDDRSGIEAGLSPHAAVAWKALLEGKEWKEMRGDLWHANAGGSYAVGYRFEKVGRWSEPEQTLEDEGLNRNVAGDEASPVLSTQFKDRSGADCGRLVVRFSRARSGWRPAYAIDNSDIEDLLRVISSCAAR